MDEKETVIAEKEKLIRRTTAQLQEKEQQTLKLIKKMHASGMSAEVIADLLEVPLVDVEQQLQPVDQTKR